MKIFSLEVFHSVFLFKCLVVSPSFQDFGNGTDYHSGSYYLDSRITIIQFYSAKSIRKSATQVASPRWKFSRLLEHSDLSRLDLVLHILLIFTMSDYLKRWPCGKEYAIKYPDHPLKREKKKTYRGSLLYYTTPLFPCFEQCLNSQSSLLLLYLKFML